MDLEKVSQYLEYIEIEKGLSENTIEAYRRDLSAFADFYFEKPLNDITKHDINNYILYLREHNTNPRTVVRKIASFRGFFKWLSANEYSKKNPSETIEQPKLPKRLPKVMTLSEINEILRSDLNTEEMLIVELLYGCGLRVSELVNLKTTDIDIKSKLPFIPISEINNLRRNILDKLMQNRLKNYQREIQQPMKYQNYFLKELDYKANIHNNEAKKFYEKCNSKVCQFSYESTRPKNVELMRTKHCLKYAFNMCKSNEQLYLIDEKGKKYTLNFDCKKCEMIIIS